MGTIGKATRFGPKENQTPGVGQYNIGKFSNMNKAKESSFDLT